MKTYYNEENLRGKVCILQILCTEFLSKCVEGLKIQKHSNINKNILITHMVTIVRISAIYKISSEFA
jgi:hypothetical protein